MFKNPRKLGLKSDTNTPWTVASLKDALDVYPDDAPVRISQYYGSWWWLAFVFNMYWPKSKWAEFPHRATQFLAVDEHGNLLIG